MSRHLKKHSHPLLTFFALTLVIVGSLFAGSLTKPTDIPAPTMYTLEDIYNLIHNNATSTHSLSTNLTPAKSMHSVSDIYVDLANLINANNVASGTTYLGVTGGGTTPAPLTTVTIPFTPVTSAGTAIGYTLDDVYNLITENNRILTPGHAFTAPALSSSQHTLNEIYTGLTTLINPANVKSGVTYLGVAGTYVEVVTNPVWVASRLLNSVTKINGSTNTVIATTTVGSGPVGIAVDANGNIWVANSGSNSVIKINGLTNTVVATVQNLESPSVIAVDANGNIWVTSIWTDTLTKINGSNLTNIDTMGNGNSFGIAADASGNIWVTNYALSSVIKIDSSTNAVIATVSLPAGSNPRGTAVDSSGNVWVVNQGNNSVTKINGFANTVITTIPVGSSPYGVAADANGNIWVTNASSNSVSKIDSIMNTIIDTVYLPVGTQPYGIAVDASGNIWVANSGSNSVIKINTLTNVVTQVTLPAGNYSYSISVGDFTGYALQYFVLTPPAPDTIPPVVTTFNIPSTSSSTTIPISSFTAIDDRVVTGYKLTESATPPLAGDLGWTPATSTTYTFASAGTSTLYAWAKDAAGNVSALTASSTAIVVIPLPDYIVTGPLTPAGVLGNYYYYSISNTKPCYKNSNGYYITYYPGFNNYWITDGNCTSYLNAYWYSPNLTPLGSYTPATGPFILSEGTATVILP